ncbi:MAG: hypothetical protein J6T74_05640 [Clostridia bacterium]|nr:hypothetical protein [Clostridia bacterium]
MQDVKDYIKRLFKVPMLIVFFIICIVLLPSAINLRSIAFRAGIVVALGIDMVQDNKYILDAVITIPSLSEDLNENNKIITSTGTTISDALGNMNLVFGRAIRLGHVRFIVIGQALSNSNVAVAIDGVIRTNKIRDSVQLLMCESSVHELFNAGIELKNKTGIRLSDIVCHLEDYSTTSFDSNVDSFYKGYFSKTKISKLNSLSLVEDYTQGISTSPQEACGQNANGNKQSNNQQTGGKYISNVGKMAIYKDGQLQDILSEELVTAMSWINGASLPKKLVVDFMGFLNISKICYEVLSKSVVTEAFFLKGVPIYCCKINLTIDINEIISENPDIVSKSDYNNVIEEENKTLIGRQIRKQIGQALDYSKKTKLDIMDINNYFYLNVLDEYNRYMEHKSCEEFLEDIQLNVDVNIKII